MSAVLGALTIPVVDFELPLEVVILGTITGLTYGLLAVGLTLIYKSTKVLNFAHGAIGTVPAVVLPILVIDHGWPYWVALPAGLALGAGIGALLEVTVIRRLREASRLVLMVATIGVAQLLTVVGFVLPRSGELKSSVFPTPFTLSIDVGNLHIGAAEVMILALAPLLAAGLAWFLRATPLGTAARAAADNDEAAQLTGIPVRRVSLVIWTLAGLFAAGAGILVASTQPLASQGMDGGSALLVRGMAAAMIGGLVSFRRAFVGGLAIGVVQLLVQWNYPSAGLMEPLLLGVILLCLLLPTGLGSSIRGDSFSGWSLTGDVRRLPAHLADHPRVRLVRRVGVLAAIAAAALAAALLSPSQQVLFSTVMLFAVMGLSLVVLTGLSGQVSFGHFGFVMLGAVVGGRMQQLDFPSGSSFLYAVVAAALAAALVGIPALRVRGTFLAVTTLAFSLASFTWLFHQPWLAIGGFDQGTSLVISRPTWFGVDFESEEAFALLCLGLLVVTGLLVHRIRTTGVGRLLVAVRDNEPSAAALSVPPRRVKLLAFVVSGGMAGAAGWFYGALLVSFASAIHGLEQSLTLLVMVVLGGVTTITGAVLGALWVVGIPYVFGTNAGIFSSALGVLVVLLVLPGGLVSVLTKVRDRAVTRLTGMAVDELVEPVQDRTAIAASPPAPAVEATGVPVLRADDIVVSYGGIAAVDGVTIEVAAGEVLGLLGPNGAGKTTLFDVLSGQQRPSSGTVELHGVDATPLRPEQRAQLGLGRTFQQARLFGDLAVLECVMVGLERAEPTEWVPSILALPPSRRAERRKRQAALEITDLVGLGPYRSRRVAELSTGMRRMAELACVVAAGADVILLDEPTAGIAQAEVEQFAPVIRQVQSHLGATVVIIEHDIPLMMSLVDRLYVLAAGQVIAEGLPEDVRADPAVVAAYLGSDERAMSRSRTRARTKELR